MPPPWLTADEGLDAVNRIRLDDTLVHFPCQLQCRLLAAAEIPAVSFGLHSWHRQPVEPCLLPLMLLPAVLAQPCSVVGGLRDNALGLPGW